MYKVDEDLFMEYFQGAINLLDRYEKKCRDKGISGATWTGMAKQVSDCQIICGMQTPVLARLHDLCFPKSTGASPLKKYDFH